MVKGAGLEPATTGLKDRSRVTFHKTLPHNTATRTGLQAKEKCPHELRRVVVWDVPPWFLGERIELLKMDSGR